MLKHYEKEMKILTYFLKVTEDEVFQELYEEKNINVRMTYEMFKGKVSKLEKTMKSYNEVLHSLAWRRNDMKTIYISL